MISSTCNDRLHVMLGFYFNFFMLVSHLLKRISSYARVQVIIFSVKIPEYLWSVQVFPVPKEKQSKAKKEIWRARGC